MIRSKAFVWSFLLVTAISVSCCRLAAQQSGGDETNPGQVLWGGPNIRITQDAQGATLEFPCADGKILEPIKPDAKGEFTARGTYTPGQFGAIRRDNPPREQPAIYKGTISGNSMSLQILLDNKEMQPEPFALTKGSPGRLVKCR